MQWVSAAALAFNREGMETPLSIGRRYRTRGLVTVRITIPRVIRVNEPAWMDYRCTMTSNDITNKKIENTFLLRRAF